MSHQYPIAKMLTSIRNAVIARVRFVDLDLSRLNHNVLKVLEQQGFLERVLVDDQKHKMRVFLKYDGREPLIQGLKCLSKPSLRKYIQVDEIPEVRGGMGTVVISTSQGIVDGKTARQKGIGGELICYVW
jgi:small subunit ribosomal protein S8